MKKLTWALALLAVSFCLGCGSSAGPAKVTPEDEAQIQANDQAVEDAEKAQSAGAADAPKEEAAK